MGSYGVVVLGWPAGRFAPLTAGRLQWSATQAHLEAWHADEGYNVVQ